MVEKDWLAEEACPKVAVKVDNETGVETMENITTCLFSHDLKLDHVTKSACNTSLCIKFDGKRASLRPN